MKNLALINEDTSTMDEFGAYKIIDSTIIDSNSYHVTGEAYSVGIIDEQYYRYYFKIDSNCSVGDHYIVIPHPDSLENYSSL